MNFNRSRKMKLSPINFRPVFKKAQEIDSYYLEKKRHKLERLSEKIIKKKEATMKKIQNIEVMERSYKERKKQYDTIVKTVTRKLAFEEPPAMSERQKELRAFCLDPSLSNSQDSPDI